MFSRRFATIAFLFLTAAMLALSARRAEGALGVAGEWEQFPQLSSEDFISNLITCFDRDSSQRVWVGTDRGLVWSGDDGRTWNVVNLAFAQPREARRDEDVPPAGRTLVGEALIRRNTITAINAGRSGIWVGTLNGLCFGDEDLRNWTLFSQETDGIGSEIYAVAEFMGEVWISSSAGLFKSNNGGTRWEKIPGTFPSPITAITVADTPLGRTIWLAGFDAPARYGGGPDILRSTDGGRTWTAFKSGTAESVAQSVSNKVHRVRFIGRELWACTRYGLARSSNWGDSWTRVKGKAGLDIDEVFDIFSWEDALTAATSEGVYSSRDRGETWSQNARLRCPVRSLIGDKRFLWMATDGGLIVRSRASEWRSFSMRGNVLSLASTTENGTEIWWAGTTGGLACTRDGGRTWRTFTVADGMPSNLVLSLASDGERVWAGTDGGVWVTASGGEVTRRYGRESGLRGLLIRDIIVNEDDVWVATNHGLGWLPTKRGEWRMLQSNKEWRAICMAGGLIFGATIDNFDPNAQMTIVSGKADPENWQTISVQGQEHLHVRQLLTMGDRHAAGAGPGTAEIWLAADEGLFRSRDSGATWAKFGDETLWSTRVTAMCRGPNNMLCVQSVPTDPPSLMSFINVTRDGGRNWHVLAAPLPGHAAALQVVGDRLLVGGPQTQFGPNIQRGIMAAYPAFERDLRPARTGWLTWNRIAAYAASTYRRDRLGASSIVDRYAMHGPTLWFGSIGAGAVEKDVPVLEPIRHAWAINDIPLDISSFAKLTGEDVLAMADAPEGIWFGTARGLFFMDRRARWSRWAPAEHQLLSVPIRALAVNGGKLWIGTDTGLNNYSPANGAWETFRADNSALPDDRVTCLGSDGKTMWGGTHQGAFSIDESGNWKKFLAEEKVADLALGEEREYFATDRGVFALDRDGITKRHLQRENSPLNDNNVHRVFIDGPELWAATYKGIAKILYDAAEPGGLPDTAVSSRGPEGVLIVVNTESGDSETAGTAYAEARGIPTENICRIKCTTQETIARDAFVRDIRDPIRDYLLNKGLTRKISFIVTTRGVPLRIAPQAGAGAGDRSRTEASVDSELTLIGREYNPEGDIPNPYQQRDEPFNSNLCGIYLVTRLDGPSLEATLSLFRAALAVEEERSYGARGFARFDLHPLEEKSANVLNNAILHNYKLLSRQDRLHGRVTPPERTLLPLFRAGAGYNTFFYMGWGAYEYRPEVFSWIQGAIAISLDPANATTLHNPSESWVAGAVGSGVAAAIGTVYDPGTISPLSVDDLFMYTKAGYTWAEIAYMSITDLSWQTVVIGDPLYTPMR